MVLSYLFLGKTMSDFSLSHYKDLIAGNGETTVFCLTAPGVKVFPIKFRINKHYNHENVLIIDEFHFSFELFIDISHLIRCSYTFTPRAEDNEKNSISFGSDVFYEYGNEEQHLPRIKDIVQCFSEEQYFCILQEKINLMEKSENLPIDSIFLSFKNTFIKHSQQPPPENVGNAGEYIDWNGIKLAQKLIHTLKQLGEIQHFCQEKLLENV